MLPNLSPVHDLALGSADRDSPRLRMGPMILSTWAMRLSLRAMVLSPEHKYLKGTIESSIGRTVRVIKRCGHASGLILMIIRIAPDKTM